MSDDLIARLRNEVMRNYPAAYGVTMDDAADVIAAQDAEIERLKAIVDAIPDKDDPVGWVQRLAVMMDQQHILVLGPDGWSIEHPITCRLDGQAPLHECPHHIAVAEHVDMVLNEWGEGSYRIWLDDTIWCGFDGTPT